ncbi:MAG TPA: hypothetical protein PLH94_12790 [Fimbriimonadaceae bacterium]|nr:hypothetical protein [Fimbriimonadaceae bacterium]
MFKNHGHTLYRGALVAVLGTMVLAVPALAVQRVNVLQRLNATALGSGGDPITTLNAPWVNDGGRVGFMCVITRPAGTELAAWYDGGIVATFGATVSTGAESSAGFSLAGNYFFSAAASGADAVIDNGGVVLADGMPAPGFAGQFNSFNSRPHMSSDGIQTWIAGLSATSGGSTTRRVLYRRPSGGGIAVQFTGGDLIGGIATDPQGISFEHDFSNRANHWSQIFTLTGVPVTSDSVLAVDTNVIGREGFPIPNGLAGENWGTFRTPSVNENGNTLFAALTTASANQNDVLCYNNRIVLRETDTVDGVLLQNLPSNDTAISDTELGAFSFGTTDATRRIFISRANCPIGGRLLVGPGTPLDSDGDAVADFTVSRVRTSIGHDFTISNTGTVFVRLDLLPVGGGAAIECIVGLPLPKPGDANYDNEVNSDDFDLLVAAFGSVPGAGNWNAWCDFNFDCNVDSDDFDILVGNFGG